MRHPTDDRIVQRVMVNYAGHFQPTRIEPVDQAGFSGARVWKLTTPVGAFALRLWPESGLQRTRLLGLHRLLARLRDEGIDFVAVPVACSSGSSLVEANGRLWQLEPWLPGAADYLDRPSPRKLEAALSALARWHVAAATFVCSEQEGSWFSRQPAAPSPGLNERLGLTREWFSGRATTVAAAVQRHGWEDFRQVAGEILRHFQRAAPAVATDLQAAANVVFSLQPCLRDVWHDHILFTRDEVSGIVDPSACRSETVATDIARLVGSLVGDDREGWQTALAAYQSVRALTADERAGVELFDRSGVLLSGLTWLQWIAVEVRPLPDRERVLGRLRGILARLERL